MLIYSNSKASVAILRLQTYLVSYTASHIFEFISGAWRTFAMFLVSLIKAHQKNGSVESIETASHGLSYGARIRFSFVVICFSNFQIPGIVGTHILIFGRWCVLKNWLPSSTVFHNICAFVCLSFRINNRNASIINSTMCTELSLIHINKQAIVYFVSQLVLVYSMAIGHPLLSTTYYVQI